MSEMKKKIKLTVNVRLEDAGEADLPDVTASIFDATGQALADVSLKRGQGSVAMELPAELAGSTVRFIIGPRMEKSQDEVPPWMDHLMRSESDYKKTMPAALVRMGGYEKRIRLSREGGLLDLVLYPPDWQKWLLCSCVVRGRLIKRVALPDGTTQDLGVCHACIKIYEVDKIPAILYKLPEKELFRLRDDLRAVIKTEKIPIPPTEIATPVIPLPPPPEESVSPKFAADNKLSGDLDTVFHAVSSSQLRNALIAKAEVLAAYICSLDWLQFWFHMDFIKCCCTDEQGRFETRIFYRCAGDKPDLYFKALQCIGGTLNTLYDPGVICHTHWNYVCGTDVLLITDDPSAITCVPTDPVDLPAGVSRWVMPYAIGGIRLDQIDAATGLTDFTDENGTWMNVPFGGLLGFRLGYSSGIPYDVSDRPAHYRWQYNRLDSGGNETDWKEFAAPVAETIVRHYIDYDLAHPDLPPTFPAYPLGPKEKNNMHLYEFKPHEPPTLAGHKREWPVDGWFADIYSGLLQSVNLPGGIANAAGRYKIKLEVFDKDGVAVAPGAGTFDFIVPTGMATDGVTILTRKAYSSEIEGNSFIFYIHVDNNPCEAEIYETSVNGIAAGPCGFIEYGSGDDVHLSFKARHPNGFARFRFTIVRGSSGYVNIACAPFNPAADWANMPLVSQTPVNGFNRNASSVFSKDVDEAAMRGICRKAAFGENLYVAATATNGWVRLSGLDASALPKAFALEPEPV